MKQKGNWKALLFGILISLVLAECLLRILGTSRTWTEINLGYYETGYETPKGQFTHALFPPNSIAYSEREEFNYKKTSNAIGLFEREIPKVKQDSTERRLFALGDSFTEGVGAPMDSSWPRICESRLNGDGQDKYSVWNIGRAGSDPVWSYALYVDSLIDYEIDGLILAVNGTDIVDLFTYTGLERFQADGTLKYRSAPWFEPIYRHSHLFRFVAKAGFGMNEQLLLDSELEEREKYSTEKILEVIMEFRKLCVAKRLDLYIVFIPLQDDIVQGSYCFRNLFASLREANIPYLDLLSVFGKEGSITEDTVSEYFWPIDQHYNSKGYNEIGKAVASWFLNGFKEEQLSPNEIKYLTQQSSTCNN